MKPDFEKGNGLLPTVVQDAETKDVLMVAWMNEESFHKTLETRETWFWSRYSKPSNRQLPFRRSNRSW